MTIEDLNNVPKEPGVYLWKDAYGTIIYVGKAKVLRNRMKQYFKGMLNSYKTSTLVSKIESFEYIITSSDKEALVLERNLIEEYMPEFNIMLTDDKRYPYIKLKKYDDRIDISLAYRVRQDRDKKALFYGPFPTGHGARTMTKLLNRITSYKNGLPYHSKDPVYWEEQFSKAKKILSASNASLINQLKAQMMEAAENLQFEIAADIKNTIEALIALKDKQAVELNSNENIDVIGVVEKDGYLSISTFFYRAGNLLSKKERVVSITSSKEETLRQFFNQYYSINVNPDYLISNEVFESSLKLVNPQKGTKKQILDNAIKNAQDSIDLKLMQFVRKEELTIGALKKLEKLIGVSPLSHILMIDNSNTNNTLPVSAIVSYRNGIKNKKEYRKYNLVTGSRLADVDYMKQGVTRYFSKEENVIPDLFIVDGGKQQVSEVKGLLPKGLPLIGLVKNDKHATDAIIDSNGVRIEIEDTTLLNFLREMQIEVDRFAKSFHMKKRKTTLEGVLSTIKGVGPSTEKRLLDEFKSYSGIYNATKEDLSKVVSETVAEAIVEKMKGI